MASEWEEVSANEFRELPAKGEALSDDQFQ